MKKICLGIGNIEDYKNRYVGSDEELKDIKVAYEKHNGNFAEVLRDVFFVETKPGKRRTLNIIKGMVDRGEVRKIPDRSEMNAETGEVEIIAQQLIGAMQNWKSIKKKEPLKLTYSCPEVIEIEDSDSDQSTVSSDKLPRMRRPLKQSFSSDEEDDEKGAKCDEPLEESERSSLLRKRRCLSYRFSDDEEDIKPDFLEGFDDKTTPLTGIENMDVSKLENNFMHPVACSTPLHVSNSSIPDDFLDYSHVGLADLSTTSQNSCLNYRASSSNVNLETTLVVPGVASKQTNETTIHVLQNVVLQQTIATAETVNSKQCKRRSTDREEIPKKLKTSHTSDDCNRQSESDLTFTGLIDKIRETKQNSVDKTGSGRNVSIAGFEDTTLHIVSPNQSTEDEYDPKLNKTTTDRKEGNNNIASLSTYEDITQRLFVENSPGCSKQQMNGETLSNNTSGKKCEPKWLTKLRIPKEKQTNKSRLSSQTKETATNKKGCSSKVLPKEKTPEYRKDGCEKPKIVADGKDGNEKWLEIGKSTNCGKHGCEKSKVVTDGRDSNGKSKITAGGNEPGLSNEDLLKGGAPGHLTAVVEKSTIASTSSIGLQEGNKKTVTTDAPNSQDSGKTVTDKSGATSEKPTRPAKSTKGKRADIQTSPSQNHTNRVNTPSTPSKTAERSKTPYPSDSSLSPVKTKKEERKMNTETLKQITDLFKDVFATTQTNNLLDDEKKAIGTFLDMDHKYQYVCLKLIVRQKKWYNVFKFCKLICVDMEEGDISDMFRVLKEKMIIDTDYLKDDVNVLLPRLDNTELRKICDKFRLKKTLKKKEDMIASLLKYCATQPTLNVKKSTKDLLLDEMHMHMGKCMRVSEGFQGAFQATYVLATFTNSTFADMKDFFKSFKNVVFPQYPIDEYTIFGSRTDFTRYAKARKYLYELNTLTVPDHLQRLQLCRTIFSELKAIENDKSDEGRFEDAPHLVRFTARAVYVSALSSSVDKLFCKFPQDVKLWLEYMIKKVDFPHKIGYWYYYLVWLYMKYLQPFNYDRAAELLIEVLQRKRQHLSEVQLYHLRDRAERLTSTKKYKILQMNHDCIVQLLPKPIGADSFPEWTVDAKTIRSNDLGKKRNYELRDTEGNKTILTVEDIALNDYLERLHYTDGVHCEGALVKATFTLFFFDIIYSSKTTVPGTFVSKMQSEPLDMNSRYFYKNRKQAIDARLREIESGWSDGELLRFLKENYERHSHELTLCEVGVVIKKQEMLEILVECVGRRILAGIYKRLVKNYREYRSGLPDLLVWDTERKRCKFVEVKGENDKLSVGQKLWLNYLRSIGADIEVCHVHSIGSKRKLKKVVNGTNQPGASTSRSSPGLVP